MARLLLPALLLLSSFLAGCELIADFDRSKIPQPARDSGTFDASEPPPVFEEDAGAEDDDAG